MLNIFQLSKSMNACNKNLLYKCLLITQEFGWRKPKTVQVENI